MQPYTWIDEVDRCHGSTSICRCDILLIRGLTEHQDTLLLLLHCIHFLFLTLPSKVVKLVNYSCITKRGSTVSASPDVEWMTVQTHVAN